MKNAPFRVIVGGILILTSVLMAYVVGLFLKLDIFLGIDTGEFYSTQMLTIAIGFPLLFLFVGYLRFGQAIIASLLLSLLSGWYLSQATDFGILFGGVAPFVSYFVLYGAIACLLKWIWMNPSVRILKGLRFSILSAIVFCAMLLGLQLTVNNQLSGSVILQYFTFSLIVFITETVAVTIAERIYTPLALRWKVADFMEEDVSESPEDDDVDKG